MISIFTIPKPFEGHNAVIQRNAIQSWLALAGNCEIFLVGDDDGVAETAAEFKINHIPEVKTNEYGTPLLDSAFEMVQDRAAHDTLCYVNGDILFLDDFPPAVRLVQVQNFLLLGQRYDIDITQQMNFDDARWQERLRNSLKRRGTLHLPSGMDYFVFRKGSFDDLPPFAVGRPGWDSWFVWNALRLGRPVIDATPVITAVHQNHGYRHVAGGDGNSYDGPEAMANWSLMKTRFLRGFQTLDATHVLSSDGLRRRPFTQRLRPKWERLMRRYPMLRQWKWNMVKRRSSQGQDSKHE